MYNNLILKMIDLLKSKKELTKKVKIAKEKQLNQRII